MPSDQVRPPAEQPIAELGAHVLGVHDVDTIGELVDDRDGVATTARDVARVEAEPDRTVPQHPVDLVGVLHHRSPVRMQAGGDSLGRTDLADPVEVLEQGAPARLVEHRPGVVAVGAGVGGQDEVRPTGDPERLEFALHRRDRVGVRIVHDREEERPHGGEPEPGDSAARARAATGSQPCGPNSVAVRPISFISPSTRSGLIWYPQSGNLTHAPADRGTGNLHATHTPFEVLPGRVARTRHGCRGAFTSSAAGDVVPRGTRRRRGGCCRERRRPTRGRPTSSSWEGSDRRGRSRCGSSWAARRQPPGGTPA